MAVSKEAIFAHPQTPGVAPPAELLFSPWNMERQQVLELRVEPCGPSGAEPELCWLLGSLSAAFSSQVSRSDA